MPDAPLLIDAEELVRRYSVEDLAATAEQYFAAMASPDYLHSKPFGAVSEAPTVLAHLAAMLDALHLSPGMEILDFGAGSCWTSRAYAQLGCQVVATDVSQTALEFGRQLFERIPVVGPHVAPRFLWFDGHRLDLPDASVDRVACMDAFHHVPNRDEVLSELFRVLRPGGRAVLAEGGPHHSQTAQAQAEMRSYTVVERDIVVTTFADEVRAAGFAGLQVGIYAGAPVLVAAEQFDQELANGRLAALATRTFLDNHRLLVLLKGGVESVDSRRLDALAATLDVQIAGHQTCRASITNTGRGRWLGGQQKGTVNLGIHLYDAGGALVDLDFHRHPTVVPPAADLPPGASVELVFSIPPLPPGRHVLEFDLVSEGIAWFAMIGATPVRHVVDVPSG